MSGTNPEEPQAPVDSVGQADPLENALDQSGVGIPVAKPPPVYKAMPETRIPVSNKRGGVWRSRKDIASKQMQDLIDAWDEAIRYYNHDQQYHRVGHMGGSMGGTNTSGNRGVAKRLSDQFSSTENIVFSNIVAQVPELYAKNPIITVTSRPTDDEATTKQGDDFARAVEKLVNTLFGMKAAPGVNVKTKAKQNVLVTLLTNRAWFEVGYVQKDKSSDQAHQDLLDLSMQLEKAKDDKEIMSIEQQLVALEQKIEFLQPPGPYVRVRLPHQVLIDPDCCDPYLSDANWVMVEDMLPTEYINAVYGMKQPDSDEVASIFEPTHVLNSGGDGADTQEFSLFSKDQNTYNAYGFDTPDAYDKAKRTKIWYVWDRVTRRLEMYADNDWSWPIWVWDDPYQLQNFFPLTPMWFHDSPTAIYAKGEVSYYLDQQDQINEINDEKRRALLWARRNIFYNPDMGITQEMAEKILKGPDATATPLKLPEGMKPTEAIFSIPPPSMAFAQLFDKKDLYASVDRIASTNEVERGGEFKTNTTNRAIDYYSTMGNMRMDMRLDAIEDALGDVGWKIAQLCLRFMDAQIVSELIGHDVTAYWRPLNNLEDFAKLSVVCVGGSTQKMTTQGKKQEAVQVGQVLAQYVKAAPSSALKATLTMMSKAFDDFQITKEDWEAIDAEVQQMVQAQQGGAPNVGGVQSGGKPAGGPPPMSGVGGGGGMQQAQVVVQALSQLPPQVLQAIGNALAQGIPPAQIFAQMIQQPQQQAQAPTPQPTQQMNGTIQ